MHFGQAELQMQVEMLQKALDVSSGSAVAPGNGVRVILNVASTDR